MGRRCTGIHLVEKVPAETGFEIVRCFRLSEIDDQELANESVQDCFERLASDEIYGGVSKPE